jgi:DNA end-binding protein Ku
MYFSDEVRSPGKELPELPENGDVSDRELSMAQMLIESMESEWDPERFHDTHREKVQALIDEKASGKEIVIQSAPEEPAKVIDLMEALNASIKAAAKPGAKSGADAPAKRSPSRRAAPAAKKASKTAKKPARAKQSASRRKAS